MVSTRSRGGVNLPAPRRPVSRGKRYKDSDNCKRHRLPDNKAKTVVVPAHTRRK
jgi:hypothetical protein